MKVVDVQEIDKRNISEVKGQDTESDRLWGCWGEGRDIRVAPWLLAWANSLVLASFMGIESSGDRNDHELGSRLL